MKLKIFLPIAAAVLLLVGAALLAVLMTTPNNNLVQDVTLKDNDVTRESLEFSANGLLPGEARGYTINLKGSSAGSYAVKLEFVEVTDGALKEYVEVTVRCGDQEHTYKLSELLAGTTVEVSCKVKAKETTVIEVIYEIPEEVDNSAQSATADFVINLTAEQV